MKQINNEFKYKTFIIFSIVFIQNFFGYIKFLLSNYSLDKEYKNIENYLKKCSVPGYLPKININVSKNPKISIISPVYNTGKFVLRLIKSIQYQSFKDLEIILIDDYSDDNSIELK